MDIEREFYQSAFNGDKPRYKELYKQLNPTLEMVELACFNAYHNHEDKMMKYIIVQSNLSDKYDKLYNNLIVSIKVIQERHDQVMEKRKSDPGYNPKYTPLHDKHLRL
jgi:hypothetical protein